LLTTNPTWLDPGSNLKGQLEEISKGVAIQRGLERGN
jgi:hypothetical protein